jgi:hypothetical protein
MATCISRLTTLALYQIDTEKSQLEVSFPFLLAVVSSIREIGDSGDGSFFEGIQG